ncbi:hypothetical protein KC323_g209 [Hortaea werneckii]|nr:hypothetical protein KC323_g209 [Hortaea werneckii]
MSASNLCGFQKSRAWIGGLRVEILVVFRHIFIRHLSPSQSFEAGVTGGAVVTSIPEGLIHRQVIQRCASNEVGPFDILRAQIRHKQFRECLFSSSTLCHVWPKHGWQERQSATLAAIVQRLDITTLFDLEHLQTTVISNSASVSSSTIGMIWLRPSSGSYVRSSILSEPSSLSSTADGSLQMQRLPWISRMRSSLSLAGSGFLPKHVLLMGARDWSSS